MTLLEDAHAILPWMSELRRRVHSRPELGLELPETQALVIDALAELGLDAVGAALFAKVALEL